MSNLFSKLTPKLFGWNTGIAVLFIFTAIRAWRRLEAAKAREETSGISLDVDLYHISTHVSGLNLILYLPMINLMRIAAEYENPCDSGAPPMSSYFLFT